MSFSKQLVYALASFPVILCACDSDDLIIAPRNLVMTTIEKKVYERERFENFMDHFVSLRSFGITGTALFTHVAFMARGIPQSYGQACTDCTCPLGWLFGTCCVEGIIKIGSRYSESAYEKSVIESMKHLNTAEQEAIIDEIAQKNSTPSEKIHNIVSVISWLRTCQQKANVRHEHID